MIIKITKKTAGIRLDKFLAEADVWGKTPLSRSQIQKLIEQKIILINGSPASSHYSLKLNDKINIQKKLIKNSRKIQAEKVAAEPDHKVEIIQETDEFLIINKPAGLAVEAMTGYTLGDWLKARYPKISKVGDDPARPGIVHRLDKEVSGLMVIAKTRASFDNLKKQFRDRTIAKEYTALVHGKIQKESSVINFPIKRSREGYKMAAIPETVKGQPTEAGRQAETEFRIITRLINYTLLKVKIKTGRTHQIRVHLAAYGNPVVGDKIYGTARTKSQNLELNLNRIFLIADHLGFSDLKGDRHDFQIGLTEELKNLLKKVK